MSIPVGDGGRSGVGVVHWALAWLRLVAQRVEEGRVRPGTRSVHAGGNPSLGHHGGDRRANPQLVAIALGGGVGEGTVPVVAVASRFRREAQPRAGPAGIVA